MSNKNIQWGGSGIEKCTFDYIRHYVLAGSTIIELGSGNVSTPALAEHYNVISVEHDENWVGIHEDVTYIHAPVKGNWYDTANLRDLPDHTFVLIDGVKREGILHNLDLFNPKAMYMVHDTYRPELRTLAFELAQRLGRNLFINTIGDHFAVI